jgi:methionyl-tRNA formyltransferase
MPPALPVNWSDKKYSRDNYRALCEIPLDISKGELERRMRVFGGNYFGVTPTINLHGVKFRAMVPPAVGAEAAVAAEA